jgi:hypothetical protein
MEQIEYVRLPKPVGLPKQLIIVVAQRVNEYTYNVNYIKDEILINIYKDSATMFIRIIPIGSQLWLKHSHLFKNDFLIFGQFLKDLLITDKEGSCFKLNNSNESDEVIVEINQYCELKCIINIEVHRIKF